MFALLVDNGTIGLECTDLQLRLTSPGYGKNKTELIQSLETGKNLGKRFRVGCKAIKRETYDSILCSRVTNGEMGLVLVMMRVYSQ